VCVHICMRPCVLKLRMFALASLGPVSARRAIYAYSEHLIPSTCTCTLFLSRAKPAKGRAQSAKLQTSRCSIVRCSGSREIHFSPVNTFIRMYAVLSPWTRPRERKRERTSAWHGSERSGKSIFLSFRPRIKSGSAAGHAVRVVRLSYRARTRF